MSPMLARTYGPKYSHFPCYLQPKLNGIRALNQKSTMQSRDSKLWRPNVLEHITSELRSIMGHWDGILDGELYLHGRRLQKINSAVAVNRSNPSPETLDIEYHVFDVVDPASAFADRWLPVYRHIAQANLPHIKAVETMLVANREEAIHHFHRLTNLGYEGIMLRPNGPYEFGETTHGTQKRSEFLWKHKQWQDDEFRCVDVTWGVGKADIGIGALICVADKTKPWAMPLYEKDWVNLFKVGTGFDDDERREFSDKPPTDKLIKVRFLEYTEDGKPFNPSFLAALC